MSQIAKVVLAFTGVFVAGAVAGGIVALRVGMEQAAKQAPAGQTPPPPKVLTVTPDNFGPAKMRQLTKQLTLTDVQKAEIQPLIDDASEKIARLSQKSRADTNALIEDMEQKISVVLTDVQKKALTDLQARRKAELTSRFNRPPGGGPDRDGSRPAHRQGGPPLTPDSAAPAPAGQDPAP